MYWLIEESLLIDQLILKLYLHLFHIFGAGDLIIKNDAIKLKKKNGNNTTFYSFLLLCDLN